MKHSFIQISLKHEVYTVVTEKKNAKTRPRLRGRAGGVKPRPLFLRFFFGFSHFFLVFVLFFFVFSRFFGFYFFIGGVFSWTPFMSLMSLIV